MYRCKTCKSINIDRKEWANVNTGEYKGSTDDDEIYCNVCNETINWYKDVEEIKEN